MSISFEICLKLIFIIIIMYVELYFIGEKEMEFAKDIYFDNNLTAGKSAKITC